MLSASCASRQWFDGSTQRQVHDFYGIYTPVAVISGIRLSDSWRVVTDVFCLKR